MCASSGACTRKYMLPIDPAPPWPEGAEDLRALFAELPPMENPPDAEFIYIAAPMPEDSGYPYCAVGARAEGGEIAAIRYAPRYRAAASAAAVASFNDSPIFFGAVTVPA